MKKFSGILFLLVLSVLSCSQYDDSEIWNYVKEMNTRLTSLEEKCKEMNTNISSLQTLVAAFESGDYITNVAPVTKDGKTIGYTITFHKSGAITIYNGTDGINGSNGTNGTNGYTPVIGVKKFTDGLYYWTIDGEWLLDANNNKVRASGIDGQNGTNGTNGTNGENGKTPQLKIEDDYWYVSYDSGATWQKLGKATGDKGDEGQSFFNSVEVGAAEVTFVLADGNTFVLPLHYSEIGYVAVDLGLPSGTKWANKNLGAKTECDYGDYCRWGWTKNSPENYQNYLNYKYSSGAELELVDDAAYVELGAGWQIPNLEQAEELYKECTFRKTTIMGVFGVEVSGKNGNTIFLPATGYDGSGGLQEVGYYAFYSLRNRGEKYSNNSYTTYQRMVFSYRLPSSQFLSGPVGYENDKLYTIRPVYKEQ